ncbi:MAG: hypothetical protein AB7L65_03950 [Hyphomonadaceae bacterium]
MKGAGRPKRWAKAVFVIAARRATQTPQLAAKMDLQTLRIWGMVCCAAALAAALTIALLGGGFAP